MAEGNVLKSGDIVQEYDDIVLLGKTGQGKSTTGNKLLRVHDNNKSYKYTQYTSRLPGLLKQLAEHVHTPHFKEGVLGGVTSTTDQCQMISNDHLGVRVLDVPGFADSGLKSGESVYSNNLALIRQLVRIQIDQKLKIQYLVYFLPARGVLERADGVLQEEIRVMHYFFGMRVFKYMVLVVTRSPYSDQCPLNEKEIAQTKKAFTAAVEQVTSDKGFKCPPIIFISQFQRGPEILEELKKAREPNIQDPLQFEIKQDVCSKCAAKTVYVEGSKECVAVVLKSSDGTSVDYDESVCHPMFIPKHATLTKVVRGIVNIVLAPLVIVGEAEYSTSNYFGEECVNCEQEPGAQGCHKVKTEYKIKVAEGSEDARVTVDHSNKVVTIVIEDKQ